VTWMQCYQNSSGLQMHRRTTEAFVGLQRPEKLEKTIEKPKQGLELPRRSWPSETGREFAPRCVSSDRSVGNRVVWSAR
jgi:hypothetical protein